MAQIYHVYVDFQSHKVAAIASGIGGDRIRYLEKLWTIMAQNADDAFKQSVEKGLVRDRMLETYDARDKNERLIRQWSKQPSDGTGMPNRMISMLNHGTTYYDDHLNDLRAIEERYRPPVPTLK